MIRSLDDILQLIYKTSYDNRKIVLIFCNFVISLS